jgi:hypothetical protein
MAVPVLRIAARLSTIKALSSLVHSLIADVQALKELQMQMKSLIRLPLVCSTWSSACPGPGFKENSRRIWT